MVSTYVVMQQQIICLSSLLIGW